MQSASSNEAVVTITECDTVFEDGSISNETEPGGHSRWIQQTLVLKIVKMMNGPKITTTLIVVILVMIVAWRTVNGTRKVTTVYSKQRTRCMGMANDRVLRSRSRLHWLWVVLMVVSMASALGPP
jgi:hypothetical protein